MRLVLDTNTVISGLLWQGSPSQLIDAATSGRVHLFTSIPLLAELEGVLNRRKFSKPVRARGLDVSDLVAGYSSLATIVNPAPFDSIDIRDPDDRIVLACALAARADLIVSGDADLLILGSCHEVPIVNASRVMESLGRPGDQ